MNMIEIVNKTKRRIDKGEVRKYANFFFKYRKLKDVSLSIIFVGDKEMRSLNRKYRQVDSPTDVLSFVLDEDFEEGDYLGEVFLDYQQIVRQAKEEGKNVKDELIFIMYHGLLHLLGYTDDKEKDRRKMIREAEEAITYFKKNA